MAHCATWLSRLRGIEEPPYDLWRTSELEESFALALLGTPDGGQGALQPARGAAAELSPAELAFAAMERAWDDGCRVARPNAETAAVAARRWQSSQRRGVAERDRAARIEDLVKGLIAHVEPDRSMVGRLKVDYEYLATAIANALEPAISNAKK